MTIDFDDLKAILEYFELEYDFDAVLNIHKFIKKNKNGEAIKIVAVPAVDEDGEDKENEIMNEHHESMVNIPVKQYAESIMAIQKLKDIHRIVYSPEANRSDYAVSIVKAIRAITAIKESGERGE